LAQIVENCLSDADKIVDEENRVEPDLTTMTDEQLQQKAVCNELVYGDYDTEHRGFLQEHRDFDTFTRMPPEVKQGIYNGIKRFLGTWLRNRQRGRHEKVFKFYTYVASDILKKIRKAFGLPEPPPPPLIPLNSGGKRKTRKSKRKNKRK